MREFQKISTRKRGGYESVFREKRPSLFRRLAAIFGHAIFFWLAVFVGLFWWLEREGRFYFFFIEQRQLFLNDSTFIAPYFTRPGGAAQLVADYMTQFFILPHRGAALMSALLTGVAMLSVTIMRRIAPQAPVFLIGLLPTAVLLTMTFDINYSYAGTVAYALMLILMYFYFLIPSAWGQGAYATAATALLFWLGGSIAYLFAMCIFAWELATRFLRAYGFPLPLVVSIAAAVWGIYNAWANEYRFLLGPDGYYAPQAHAGPMLYIVWGCPAVMLAVSYFMRGWKCEKPQVGRWLLHTTLQLAVIGGVLWFGRGNLTDNDTSGYSKEADYYLRQGRWDTLINGYVYNTYKHTPANACMLSIALAERGELADRLFAYDPSGVEDILPAWDRRDPQMAALLSDLYFSMGYIDMAQRMALESNAGMDDRSPRMIKRLVQTSLIRGAYPLAEKYIYLLERTRYYSDWARSQRRFLHNDAAVEADSLLGRKRRCLTAATDNLPQTLQRIAEKNPTHRASIEYAGVILLLQKDLTHFRALADSCTGRMVLPRLPKSFQEATLLYTFTSDTTSQMRYRLPADMTRRYADFRRQADAVRSADALRESFGDTYWFYYTFKPTATK